MRHFFKPFLFLTASCLALLIFWGCATAGQATAAGPKPTVVYVVRHAEKVTDNPQDQNPNLTEAGNKRAQELKEYLKNTQVHALFATPYQRTQQTLTPLAAARSLEVQTYEAADFADIAQKIKLAYWGQTVVVAGHSNTVLPLVEALGAKKPFSEVKDHQYHYLFKVTVDGDKTPKVEVLTYGTATE